MLHGWNTITFVIVLPPSHGGVEWFDNGAAEI